MISALTVFAVFSICSIQRIHVWSDKELLWKDTVAKNPTNGKVLYKYGMVLGEEKGQPYFNQAILHAKANEWKDFSLLMKAEYEAKKLNYEKAVSLLEEIIRQYPTRKNCYQAADILWRVLNERPIDSDRVARLLNTAYQKAYERKPTPRDLLNQIKVYEYLNDKKNIDKHNKELKKKFPKSRALKYVLSRYQ
jgi:Tfp pilus assembly protein PilF